MSPSAVVKTEPAMAKVSSGEQVLQELNRLWEQVCRLAVSAESLENAVGGLRTVLGVDTEQGQEATCHPETAPASGLLPRVTLRVMECEGNVCDLANRVMACVDELRRMMDAVTLPE